MTTITAEQALKSKQNFSEYLADNTSEIITSTLEQFRSKNDKVVVTAAELTQNFETFVNVISDDTVQNLPNPPYFVWIVTNPKENIMKTLQIINKHAKDSFGIFVFKAFLNGDKMDFECLLKPELIEKVKRVVNTQTPAKQLQKAYWEKYFEICDEIQSGMQVTPMPRHYQYITIGKAGVQIMQTVNTVDKYIGTELFINNNKEIFKKLYEHKDEIEEILGLLDWQELEGKKSSRIRQILNYDISDENQIEKAVTDHIKMAEDFRKTFKKYL